MLSSYFKDETKNVQRFPVKISDFPNMGIMAPAFRMWSLPLKLPALGEGWWNNWGPNSSNVQPKYPQILKLWTIHCHTSPSCMSFHLIKSLYILVAVSESHHLYQKLGETIINQQENHKNYHKWRFLSLGDTPSSRIQSSYRPWLHGRIPPFQPPKKRRPSWQHR